MPGNPKGDRRERELARMFDDDDWAVNRSPASGSSTDRKLPDLHAGNNGRSVVVEAKSSSGDPIYIKKKEIDGLVWYGKQMGAKPLVGVRFDREDWAFFEVESLYRTDSGNARVKKETAIEDGIPFEALPPHV